MANLEVSSNLWPEPIDTPGYIPHHLKRSATSQFPVLELMQRMLYRLKPGGDLEKVLALIGLYQAIRPLYAHLKKFFFWAFTVQVTISDTDPVAKDVLAWMGSNVILNSYSRSAMLVTGGVQGQEDAVHLHISKMYHGGIQEAGTEKDTKEVFSLPPIGTQLFWVGFRPFLFSRRGVQSIHSSSVDADGQPHNSLVITTLGWSLKPLRRFTDLCDEYMKKSLMGTTTVYFAGDVAYDPFSHGGWQSVSKAIRKLDTVDMDEATKADVIRDAEYYYSQESRAYFADCGIPYRRGYLFYGPPGTGKTSFSAALAGHLDCDIYHINLSSGTINDSGLHRLFIGLPRKCVVVMEDIDSAGIGREQAPQEDTARFTDPLKLDLDLDQNDWKRKQTSPKSITLSGLLNAIDGNASQEGRLLITTSNRPDALDDALTRPGRIDKKVYFGNIGTQAGIGMFKRLIGRAARVQDPSVTTELIEQWATEFMHKVPVDTFSPAQIQSFLQDCRGDAAKALHEIDAWVAENRSAASTFVGSEADTFVVEPADASTTPSPEGYMA
ncbi:hypothetical protein CFE70_007278 [Pyrenophora teres f. teres 0-1]|uniref:P-loop containing nucleoside triphosphate hydrolase protein n=2 Tax=Pyrenophora teres f. teres TaxID=97479 RepID=E3S7V7_PYRTT|nr:hypothetical protein PTT_18957 [Pyrenophora teres f. teres 0-1]KAE8825736.1 hypothetical protein HRS9139_08846 [Pyrenophora teres f. teres]KAE8834833.1 hypothetical protein PTNB85_06166 [Pyrenophora teres f. teres]KAE8843689.1 hypothetical protein HRS9122_04792 [Pyrenophora teres f. teres]KAE8859253.1 hypothetical protein PTNB73_08733 [Pyrenophora teres f. teres]